MKYVIDTSVYIKTYVQEQDSSKALRLRDEYHRGVHELIAPDMFPTEMGKGKVLEHFRRGRHPTTLLSRDGSTVFRSAVRWLACRALIGPWQFSFPCPHDNSSKSLAVANGSRPRARHPPARRSMN